MVTLLKILPDKWEKAKGYLRLDLEAIEAALNQRWSVTFGSDNQLQPGAIAGDYTPATRYVANTGTDNLPTWDQVDLSNGVKERLPFSHLVAASAAAVLIGRRSGSAGDFEQITLGSGLKMADTILKVDVGGIAGQLPMGARDGDDGEMGPPGLRGADGAAGSTGPMGPPGLDGDSSSDGGWPVGMTTPPRSTGSAWSVLTNGDPVTPEIMFDSNGDVIMTETLRN